MLTGSSPSWPEHAYNHWETELTISGRNLLTTSGTSDLFAFMCHFNALEMHSELVNPTRTRLKRVIIITIAVSNNLLSALLDTYGLGIM